MCFQNLWSLRGVESWCQRTKFPFLPRRRRVCSQWTFCEVSVCIVTIDIGTDSCFCVFNVLHTAWGVLYFAATAPGKRRFCSRRTYQSCPSSHQLFQASASSLLLLMSIFLNYMLNVFVYTLYIHYTYVCIYIYIYCRWTYMCVDVRCMQYWSITPFLWLPSGLVKSHWTR